MRRDQSGLPPNLQRAEHLVEKIMRSYKALEDTLSRIDLAPASECVPMNRAHFLGNASHIASRAYRVFQNNQTGVCFDEIFGPNLRGASRIVLQDPYIDRVHTARNLMELIETIYRFRNQDEQVQLHLITRESDPTSSHQAELLDDITERAAELGVAFTWEIKPSDVVHERYIQTNTGWMITLDRGLDVFKKSWSRDVLDPINRLQEFRPCRKFSITYLWRDPGESQAVPERGGRDENNV